MKISRHSGLTRIFPPRMQRQIIELLLWNVRARNREKDTQTHANKFPWKRDSSSVFSLSNTQPSYSHARKIEQMFLFWRKTTQSRRCVCMCVCGVLLWQWRADSLIERERNLTFFERALVRWILPLSLSLTLLLSFIALGVRWCWHTRFRGELI